MASQTTKRRVLPARPWVLLLVDDEPDILRSCGDLLEESLQGVRVLRAGSGREGLRLLQDERIDAIISDFKMGGMDGIEFLYLAARLRPGVPRSLLTAFANDALHQRAAKEADVKAFISKAAGPEEFVDQIAALLTYEPVITPRP